MDRASKNQESLDEVVKLKKTPQMCSWPMNRKTKSGSVIGQLASN